MLKFAQLLLRATLVQLDLSCQRRRDPALADRLPFGIGPILGSPVAFVLELGKVAMKEVYPEVRATKPDGGYVPIRVTGLFAAWWCYEQGRIELADLRLWFALHEVVARRKQSTGLRPSYTASELAELVGVRRKSSIRRSLSRLEAAGIATCRRSRIVFCDVPAWIQSDEGFAGRLKLISNRRRRVPVPRRLIRWLAAKSRAALIATTLGHLFRLAYFRGGECRTDGNCKASWVANVFGVSVTSVKRARAKLIAWDLLRSQETSKWYQNRYGWRGAWNLEWNLPPEGKAVRRKLLPARSKLRKTATTNRKPESLFETKTPNCKAAGGVLKPTQLRMPELRRRDLTDARRLESVFGRAVTAGWVTSFDRLNVFGAAERALRVAARSPLGLFVWLIRNRKWEFVSLADQDLASDKIRELDAMRPHSVFDDLFVANKEEGDCSKGDLLRIGELLTQVG